ncbi:hypothetical protein ONZ45_g1082 [Pleurotus djamor]|nr:hypothetical protein ONZ45_g1082 [Pleurotus djamor]
MIVLPLLKAFIVMSNALAFHWTATPPNPPVVEKERLTKGVFERTLRYQVFFLRTFVWVTAMMEVASLSHKGLTSSRASNMPLVFVVGAMICIFGSLLRLWCFKILGKMFDFQFRIHADHKLVTSGPYQYVRHPSYTGWFFMVIGVTLVVFTPGSCFRECRVSNIGRVIAATYWCIQVVVTIAMLLMRLHDEDNGLRERFGGEWDRFAQRVPYRLVPGVY